MIASCRHAFVAVALVSGMVNILSLTGSFFMLEVYDRVIPSKSVPTLVGLLILAGTLFFFLGLLDVIRTRVLIRIGATLDQALSLRVYDTIIRLPLRARAAQGDQRPLRDLDQLRGFLSSSGPSALFDLPWMPIYLAICFMFHPLIGIAASIGGILLISLTWAADILTRGKARAAATLAAERSSFVEACRRNAEVLQAMGMAARAASIFDRINVGYLQNQCSASDVGGSLGAISKAARLALQSTVLGLGAYLVINEQATAGIIIASSILTARAVAPVELAIANWKSFVTARQSWRRLNELLALFPVQPEQLALPAPVATLAVEACSAAPPGGAVAVVRDVNFRLSAGQALGIVGPSASGKSSLARLLVGAWQPGAGTVRLDGASLDHWSPRDLGRHIGYLPQDVELFDGSVTQNIARLEENPDAAAVVAAARAAGIHELVLRLSDGYETRIGEAGMALSGGQRQRLALARALYGDPFLIVLDEPYANLDNEGEVALAQAVKAARSRGAIVIMIDHRPNVVAEVDFLLVMREGRMQAFGPSEEVLKRLKRPISIAPARTMLSDVG